MAFFLSPCYYLYEFVWPFVYLNVTCLILWSAILEKCTESGQWPRVIFGSVYLQAQGPNLQRSLSSDPSQVYYSLSCLHTHSIRYILCLPSIHPLPCFDSLTALKSCISTISTCTEKMRDIVGMYEHVCV